MNHTSMVWDKRMKPHFAVGYDMMGRQNRKPYMKKAVAAYSIYTTLGDYTRFMLSLMRGEGLSVESLNTILAPAVKIETRLYWGLGIGIHESGGNTFYWHWGDNTCFRNLVIMNKADQSGVCFFTNSYFGLSISDSLAAMVFGITPRLFRLDFMSLYEQIDSNDFLFTQTLLKKGLSAARQIEAHPEEELLREYGYLLICEGKTCEAIELFTYMVDLHPLSYIAYQGLGDAYLSDGRSDIAIQYYLHSLELNPHNALLLQKVRTLKSTDVGAYHDRILQPAYNMSSPG